MTQNNDAVERLSKYALLNESGCFAHIAQDVADIRTALGQAEEDRMAVRDFNQIIEAVESALSAAQSETPYTGKLNSWAHDEYDRAKRSLENFSEIHSETIKRAGDK